MRPNKIRTKAISTFVGMALAIGGLAAPATADQGLVTHGYFDGSPSGYLGCVVTLDRDATYCFAAHVLTDGFDQGKVHVVAQRLPITSAVIEEVIAPADALQVVYVGGHPTMTLEVSLPEIGETSLEFTTVRSLGKGLASNEGCVGYELHFDLIADNPAIASGRSRGTVAGEDVSDWNGCNAFFVDTATGIWRMGT
jgi:hypothetical protein